MATEDQQRAWLAMLAKLTQPSDPAGGARSLVAFLPLTAKFPDACWTAAALDHVASQCKRLPSFAELRGHMLAFANSTRPAAGIEHDDGLTSGERQWLGYWQRRSAEGFAGSSRAKVASLIRTHAPAAWKYIEAQVAA